MIAWIARILGSVFGLKIFLGEGLMVIVSIVFYNLMTEVISEAMTFALSEMNGVSIDGFAMPSISGFGAWMATIYRIPECVSVIVAFAVSRFILTKIPFLRW